MVHTSLIIIIVYTKKTFAMWNVARIGQEKHEIRRVHNFNPLQRHSHNYIHFYYSHYYTSHYYAPTYVYW